MKKLLEIKTIIAILLTLTLVYCVAINRLPAEFIAIYGSVIGYFFVDKAYKSKEGD